jgi:hypothetical protein
MARFGLRRTHSSLKRWKNSSIDAVAGGTGADGDSSVHAPSGRITNARQIVEQRIIVRSR